MGDEPYGPKLDSRGRNLYTVIITTVKKCTLWAHSEEEAENQATKKRHPHMPYEVTKDVEVIKR
jgi:hypothetical protein